jgi:membrane protein
VTSTTLQRVFHRTQDSVQCTFKRLYDALMEWQDHRASSKGAALAFYTLFSLASIQVLAIAGYTAGLFIYPENRSHGTSDKQLR